MSQLIEQEQDFVFDLRNIIYKILREHYNFIIKNPTNDAFNIQKILIHLESRSNNILDEIDKYSEFISRLKVEIEISKQKVA